MSRLSVIYDTNNYPPSVVRSVNLAKTFMNEHPMDHVTLKKLARKVGTNEYTLKRAFKAIFKITVYQYLFNERMELAYKLLTETSNKEKAIAAQCGFATLSGFITSFQKHFRTLPKEVRKHHHQFLNGHSLTHNISTGNIVLEDLLPVA